MMADFALTGVGVQAPMQLRAVTGLTHIACKGSYLEKLEQREELANAVLQGRARQAPLVVGFESETSLGHSTTTTL